MTSPTPLTVEQQILELAKTLQKNFCCYNTEEGDNHTCDCKFISSNKIGGHEETGCAEARTIIWKLTTLTTQHTKEKEEIVKDIKIGLDANITTRFQNDGARKEILFQVERVIKEIAKNHNITI